jgi:hypothetical protein
MSAESTSETTSETKLAPGELPGTIRFHQASPPALPPGEYTLQVTQKLGSAKISQDFAADTPFTVSGPRFYLKPDEVYSVYPPAGQFGQFDNALPHIVFTRRTLPWERTIQGNYAAQDANHPVPWMALLLLGRDDFSDSAIPGVTARTVAKLLNPEGDIQGPKGLELEGGQSMNDLCNTVDLPAALFAETAPTLEDLPFLAHVREVKTGGKETLSLKQDGWFTVVLGNRMPATTKKKEGETNLVCLVSLEGFAGLLPAVDDAGNATVKLDAGKTRVRLAVLASWNFTCYGANGFKSRMVALDDKYPLSLPPDKLTASDEDTAAVRNAIALGYAGLNHTTRLGEKTVSWYRGPLVPLEMRPLDPYEFLPCADYALRFDPRNGLFAAEYAAAFELGRMMALQNRSFAAAMYRYRNRVAEDIASEARQGELRRELGGSRAAESQGSLEDAVAVLFEKLSVG